MNREKKIVQCIPNFSEGKNKDIIQKIIEPFQKNNNLTFLDFQADEDHNRLVVTLMGDPKAIKPPLLDAIGIAVDKIDMRHHKGAHPRMGAVDVVPFVPVKHMSMAEAVLFSKEVASEMANRYTLPVFLYEASASSPERKNLSDIRKGEFENLKEKMKNPAWKPDFGPDMPHATAGVSAVGARMPLVAFNVNLHTQDLKIADAIAGKVRFSGGGLRYCNAIGVALKEKKMVQVSMNMTDYTKSSLYRVFELIHIEAKRYGVAISGSEIVGLSPMQALTDVAAYYLRLENFSIDQVIESKLSVE
ncbi:MAG: glutamate formimidoyltransferase [Proteobacteria bacterium]|nr:glutamate formimidoyltransferase [Pseudomonadota bacterium]